MPRGGRYERRTKSACGGVNEKRAAGTVEHEGCEDVWYGKQQAKGEISEVPGPFFVCGCVVAVHSFTWARAAC
jgi:hypothetical protein